MRLFQVIQKKFSHLGIAPKQSKYFRKKLMITYSIYGLATTLSILFLVFNAKTLAEFVYNIHITSATIIISIFHTILVIKSDKLFDFIADGEKLIDERSVNSKAKAIYDETSQQIEKWSEIGYFIIAHLTTICWVAPRVIFCYFQYFTTDLGNDAFELPIYFWFPFNWKHPVGYIIAATFQYISCLHVTKSIACMVCFGIANFMTTMTVSNDVKNLVDSINENAKTKQNHQQTMDHISDFIKFYSRLKQLFHDFLELYQPVVLMISIWSMVTKHKLIRNQMDQFNKLLINILQVTMCGVMLLIQIEMEGHESKILLPILLCALYAFGPLIITCELCQRATDAFDEIYDRISALNWYSYSHEIQKLLPMILMGTQRPVVFEFFGGHAALRETFRKVLNKAFSYFMVVREFIK